ncbi:MAG TPA: energy transducer TonB [Povalibacter sp.]|uniref:energy transducer TonB n=1 Tax=Povalibacter sp. TaxID=1962978 RepID=UPI002B58668B|nr:energy transducer TonB [Povalibacter sp.]HMN44317.1 energy transducer TonB [Povalibacter sp.]
MNTPLKILAIAGALVSLPAFAATETCQPHVIESPTHYPIRSQIRGQEGIVYIDVRIDASGRAASTELQRSSGYRLLDRAAQQSVKNDWVFDISDCVRKDLPATHRVAVDYRNPEY